ncbi:hypothetical protein MTR67_032786 [Solanum verrucosum]|uniref:Bulb-type lectin domain-containing protein n=1 Tax=Solanum verrucosum TaxID=315347 RepID=A0AAF0U574_SOLVR|nr:hypothetical protein MTR67_032786 [Solanum verrucosum]
MYGTVGTQWCAEDTAFVQMMDNVVVQLKDGSRRGSCLLLNEVFSLINNDNEVDTAVFLKFASSQFSGYLNGSYLNSTAGLSTSWTNRPYSLYADSTYGSSFMTPILLSGKDGNKYHFCGFYCNEQSFECLLGIFFAFPDSSFTERKLMDFQLVCSAYRDHPVKANATLQLGLDGNLVLAYSDGTSVWSTNTTGESVSGLSMTETGNFVLFE